MAPKLPVKYNYYIKVGDNAILVQRSIGRVLISMLHLIYISLVEQTSSYSSCSSSVWCIIIIQLFYIVML